MNLRIPAQLLPGDLIAVTAPSSGVPEQLHPRLDLAIEHLLQRGYRVREGGCLRRQFKDQSASKRARAEELMTCLTDPNVKAVMPPWGGDRAMELLEMMDFERLKQLPPKWLVGFSDISTLQLPLALLAGWGSLHGPNLLELGARQLDSLTKMVWEVLEAPTGQGIVQYASRAYQTEPLPWDQFPAAGFKLTQPTHWQCLDGATTAISFSGRLLGGCLDILSRLVGTRYADLSCYHQQQGSEKTILYLENVAMDPCELLRALTVMRIQGWFEQLSGIILGRSAAPDAHDSSQLSYREALLDVLGDLSIPVVYDVDIGHLPPQFSLVNGAQATVHFSTQGGSISQQWSAFQEGTA